MRPSSNNYYMLELVGEIEMSSGVEFEFDSSGHVEDEDVEKEGSRWRG